ncbi:hypothetical protein KA078_02225 [Candidatus Woesebacteria bacterium]|nr:hypothetical protein [Candidatus Woesebacteria bacterium]
MFDWEDSPSRFQLEQRAQKVAAQEAERLNIRERRQMVAEALVAFREYKTQLVYDTDVLTLIQEQGSIPFDVWMNAVLYGPDGYYTSGRCKINDGHFTTVVDDPTHVAAFYAAMREHLADQEIDEKNGVDILSVAPGGGDFERHFSGMHRYLQLIHPELALPSNTRLYSLDISETNLRNDIEFSGRFSLTNLRYPYFAKDDVVDFFREDGPQEGPPFSVPIQVMKDMCSLYDCAGTIINESEYKEYYSLYILPYLQSKIDDRTYNFLTDHPEYIVRLAPFFAQSITTPIAGSGFELPFGRNTLDVIFSNEFHDAHPSKVFVVNPETDDFEELFVTYDAESQKFVLEMRSIDPAIKPMLTLKMAYVDEQDPATSAGSLPLLRLPNQEQREYLVVNMPTVSYFVEIARALKSGGMIIEGDYVQSTEHEGKTSYNLEQIRTPAGDGYGWLLDHMDRYNPPWYDVTTDMNPGFLLWLAPALGLMPLLVENQSKFTNERAGRTHSWRFDDKFQVVAFVKK